MAGLPPQNVKIPYRTFEKLVLICEAVKQSLGTDEGFECFAEIGPDVDDVLEVLHAKIEALDVRDAYSKLITANKGSDYDRQVQAKGNYDTKKYQRRDWKR